MKPPDQSTNRIWAIKCNNSNKRADGWHWSRYFSGKDGTRSQPFAFGGRDRIRSAISIKFIQNEVRSGDLVVCYQTDDKAILGLTKMASDGEESEEGSGVFDMFWLAPCNDGFLIDPPLKIKDLREAGSDPTCFSNGVPPGTVFDMSHEEFANLVRILNQSRPRSRNKLARWLGAPDSPKPDGEPEPNPPKGNGAGFSTDAEENRRVEIAAIDIVCKSMKADGWEIRSVESEKCGYDLCCMKRGMELHVEVKGVTGSEPSFIVTAQEYKQARCNPKFRLKVVTNTLSKPFIREWTGSQFRRCFELHAIQFKAKLRTT